ncbi:TIGR02922 family protein [Colwellia sp. MSW7]|uniref:TIGR02922 family protein n=1 Tax=Colwellia maritima TaxID=2912588 RepID=A0ABS9X3D9_9GAMM|nr:TIGR02922 family protein [Colwellia maritima]MCI2284701.1 TIGR02922 family protein [Colwellia maritima]
MIIIVVDNMTLVKRKVTIIYYQDDGLELHHKVKSFDQNADGRVIIPQAFKDGKSIIAVCDGEVQILNKVGDRILSVNYVMSQKI